MTYLAENLIDFEVTNLDFVGHDVQKYDILSGKHRF